MAKRIKQIHSGTGDNVARDKTVVTETGESSLMLKLTIVGLIITAIGVAAQLGFHIF